MTPASDVFFLWGDLSPKARKENIHLRRRLEMLRSEPVGIMGIPVGIYLDIYEAVAGPDPGSDRRIVGQRRVGSVSVLVVKQRCDK